MEKVNTRIIEDPENWDEIPNIYDEHGDRIWGISSIIEDCTESELDYIHQECEGCDQEFGKSCYCFNKETILQEI